MPAPSHRGKPLSDLPSANIGSNSTRSISTPDRSREKSKLNGTTLEAARGAPNLRLVSCPPPHFLVNESNRDTENVCGLLQSRRTSSLKLGAHSVGVWGGNFDWKNKGE